MGQAGSSTRLAARGHAPQAAAESEFCYADTGAAVASINSRFRVNVVFRNCTTVPVQVSW